MSFVTFEFIVLMAVVFAVYWGVGSLASGRRVQNVVLAVASAVFYGWVHPWFLGLLAYSTLLDYSLARGIEADRSRAKIYVALSVAGNLALLGYFKYMGFFVDSLQGILAGATDTRTLGVLLPVGISFYTFQTMGYTVDVYRRRTHARTDLLDYFVYVSFFPQLVAGPIERASRLLPQLESARVFHSEQILSGLSLAMWGAFKKVAIGDFIAREVDGIFMMASPNATLTWVAAAGFAVQMLADFSGYTDIARGTARMLGVRLSRNFDKPFLAASTPELWRRYHISLGDWMMSMVYEPLVNMGKRSGFRVGSALFITFLLLGLWHGGSWNFVAMGMVQAVAAIGYTFLGPMVPTRVKVLPGAWVTAVAFHSVVVGLPTMIFFREPSAIRAVGMLAQSPFGGSFDQQVVAGMCLGSVTLLGMSPMLVAIPIRDRIGPWVSRRRWAPVVHSAWWCAAAIGVIVMRRHVVLDFIYFQF